MLGLFKRLMVLQTLALKRYEKCKQALIFNDKGNNT